MVVEPNKAMYDEMMRRAPGVVRVDCPLFGGRKAVASPHYLRITTEFLDECEAAMHRAAHLRLQPHLALFDG